jgi:esterase
MTVALAWREYGSGQPLVLLHGLFGSRSSWYVVSKLLSSHFRVLVPDLRNHGDSPWATGMSYIDMAEDIRVFLEEHAPDGASILGHSMGGKVAMALALLHPGRLRKLLVVDIAPADYPDNFSEYIEAAGNLNIGELKSHQAADLLLKEHIISDAVRGLLLQNLVRRREFFEWRINFASILANMRCITGFPDELSAHRCQLPVRFMSGAASDYVLEQHRCLIGRLFPSATFETIPDAGHWVHIDQPALLVQSVRHWLGEQLDLLC